MAITISGNGITSSEIASNTITSGNLADGTILNADINASAAIAGSKVDGSFGKVLQVVSFPESTAQSSTTALWADTLLTLNITPSYATSKVVVLLSINGCYKTGSSLAYLQLKLFRGATEIVSIDDQVAYDGTTASQGVGTVGLAYEDSPASTSAVTYKVRFRNAQGSGTVRINEAASTTSTITLMEIGA
jgi:hypothetical protein